MDQGFYVTDRRVLLVGYMFRVLKFEYSLWFEEAGVPDNNDIVKEVNVRKSRIAGPYLEIVAESPVKQWLRSRQATIHIFMRNPEPVRKIIAEAMTRNS
jgi:cytidylate kinase